MKKLVSVAAAVCVFAGALTVTAGSAAVIKTNWVERTPISGGGTYTVYVRELRITRTTWRARVGLANRTGKTMKIQYGLLREGARTILRHGPGVWFNGPLAPGSSATGPRHVDATSVRPALPHTLPQGKSWFGTIEGPTTKLPRDRLLRIGFGWIEHDFVYPTEISTTHQFRLPRRL
jgi:hypothetical protein